MLLRLNLTVPRYIFIVSVAWSSKLTIIWQCFCLFNNEGLGWPVSLGYAHARKRQGA
jgi:hypothetical protein